MEVICDSGPLMALGKLNLLYLLRRLYGKVVISNAVYKEAVTSGRLKGYQDASTIELFLNQNRWEAVEVDTEEIDSEIRSLKLDDGEIESIHLAMKTADSLILLDDEKAREEARKRGLRVKGTVGILVEAYRRNMIGFEELKLFFEEIAKRRDIWISRELCKDVIRELSQNL